jgi:hypothetical protein
MKAKFSTQKNSLKAKFGANKIPGSMKSKFGTKQNSLKAKFSTQQNSLYLYKDNNKCNNQINFHFSVPRETWE